MYPKPQDGFYATAPPAVPPPMGGPQYYAAPPVAQYYPPPAPPPIGTQTHKHMAWSTGLCDCSDDCGSCCMTCFCPCVTFGRIAEIVDRGSTSCGTAGALYTVLACFTGCQCFYSCFTRKKMRAQYSLSEQPCNDCCVHLCCEACALCQEYRELKNRGFDMTIGWQSNTGMVATMPPMMPGQMMR